MSPAAEPLTPVDIEHRLRQLVNDLASVRRVLAAARDAEVDAKHAYERGRRAAILGPDCPKVTRNGYTTAERDAWVDEKAAELRFAYDKAVVTREAAQDHLKVLMAQAEVVRSLGASVRQAYELAGAS